MEYSYPLDLRTLCDVIDTMYRYNDQSTVENSSKVLSDIKNHAFSYQYAFVVFQPNYSHYVKFFALQCLRSSLDDQWEEFDEGTLETIQALLIDLCFTDDQDSNIHYLNTEKVLTFVSYLIRFMIRRCDYLFDILFNIYRENSIVLPNMFLMISYLCEAILDSNSDQLTSYRKKELKEFMIEQVPSIFHFISSLIEQQIPNESHIKIIIGSIRKMINLFDQLFSLVVNFNFDLLIPFLDKITLVIPVLYVFSDLLSNILLNEGDENCTFEIFTILVDTLSNKWNDLTDDIEMQSFCLSFIESTRLCYESHYQAMETDGKNSNSFANALNIIMTLTSNSTKDLFYASIHFWSTICSRIEASKITDTVSSFYSHYLALLQEIIFTSIEYPIQIHQSNDEFQISHFNIDIDPRYEKCHELIVFLSHFFSHNIIKQMNTIADTFFKDQFSINFFSSFSIAISSVFTAVPDLQNLFQQYFDIFIEIYMNTIHNQQISAKIASRITFFCTRNYQYVISTDNQFFEIFQKILGFYSYVSPELQMVISYSISKLSSRCGTVFQNLDYDSCAEFIDLMLLTMHNPDNPMISDSKISLFHSLISILQSVSNGEIKQKVYNYIISKLEEVYDISKFCEIASSINVHSQFSIFLSHNISLASLMNNYYTPTFLSYISTFLGIFHDIMNNITTYEMESVEYYSSLSIASQIILVCSTFCHFTFDENLIILTFSSDMLIELIDRDFNCALPQHRIPSLLNLFTEICLKATPYIMQIFQTINCYCLQPTYDMIVEGSYHHFETPFFKFIDTIVQTFLLEHSIFNDDLPIIIDILKQGAHFNHLRVSALCLHTIKTLIERIYRKNTSETFKMLIIDLFRFSLNMVVDYTYKPTFCSLVSLLRVLCQFSFFKTDIDMISNIILQDFNQASQEKCINLILQMIAKHKNCQDFRTLMKNFMIDWHHINRSDSDLKIDEDQMLRKNSIPQLPYPLIYDEGKSNILVNEISKKVETLYIT